MNKKSLIFASLILSCARFSSAQTLTSISPGTPALSFNSSVTTVADGTKFAVPGRATIISWQTSFLVSPASITVNLQGSLDNVSYFTLDSSTVVGGAIRYLGPTAIKFIRCSISASSGGSGFTCSINVYGNTSASIASGGTLTSNLTMASGTRILAANGTAALPSYSFTALPTTGFYYYDTAGIAFSHGAVSRLYFGSANFNLSSNMIIAWTNSSSNPNTTVDLQMFRVASGQLNIIAATNGIGLDVATDGVLKIRTRAQTGDASLTAASITASANLTAGAAFNLIFGNRSLIHSSVDGKLQLENQGSTLGVELKFDALPTAGTCGTSPAVIAGATPFSGSINVGTATPASCVVTFNGTAFPSAPNCTANVVTSTAGNVRAIGTLSTTTQVTFTPATAFADSSIVAWNCVSAK